MEFDTHCTEMCVICRYGAAVIGGSGYSFGRRRTAAQRFCRAGDDDRCRRYSVDGGCGGRRRHVRGSTRAGGHHAAGQDENSHRAGGREVLLRLEDATRERLFAIFQAETGAHYNQLSPPNAFIGPTQRFLSRYLALKDTRFVSCLHIA